MVYDLEILPGEIFYGTLRFDPLLENFLFLMKSPVQQNVKSGKADKFDLKMFISLNHKEPSERNCDRAYYNVSVPII